MKIATWNVNGIRARQVQFLEWVERDNADMICLQELKASPAQVPPTLSELPGYRNLWHGAAGYSGVSLHIRQESFKDLFPEPPHFEHPAFDFETRIVQVTLGKVVVASVYVPNGGKDFAAKLSFLQAMKDYVKATHAAGFG